jgi:uncharacterized membrane protein
MLVIRGRKGLVVSWLLATFLWFLVETRLWEHSITYSLFAAAAFGTLAVLVRLGVPALLTHAAERRSQDRPPD